MFDSICIIFSVLYWFLGLIVNHLRYPNRDTFFYMFILLNLFEEVPEIKEPIAVALLNRLAVISPPHPWGVLCTTNILVADPAYNLLSQDFIRFNPSILRYFSYF